MGKVLHVPARGERVYCPKTEPCAVDLFECRNCKHHGGSKLKGYGWNQSGQIFCVWGSDVQELLVAVYGVS